MNSRVGRTRVRVTPALGKRVQLGVKEYRNSQGNYVPLPGPSSKVFADAYHTFADWKMTEDENHGRPPYTIGGPFRSISAHVYPAPGSGPISSVVLYSRDAVYRYRGGFGLGEMGGFYEPTWFLSPSAPRASKEAVVPDMSPYVTKAWNGARPKIQQVNGFAALAELGSAPRMALTTAGAIGDLRNSARDFKDAWRSSGGDMSTPNMLPQRAADHFLNHQFGWVPFLNDIVGAIETHRDSTRLIDRITRNNGQSIRRRVTLGTESKETEILSGNGSIFEPYLGPDYCVQGQDATWKIVDVETRVTSGVGKFRYYLPQFDASLSDYDSKMSNVRRHMALYGLRISPSNLYQIVPWSWAVDWVSNVGESIHRASDYLTDGLVAEYFYVMQHYQLERKYIVTIPSHSMGPIVLESSRKLNVKQRVEGSSPYGVSLSWDNLSPRQLAIAGALGISRNK